VLLERLLIAFAPAAVAGLLLEDSIERLLFGPWPVVAAWVLGGVLILGLSARIPWQRWQAGLPLNQLDRRRALLIGLAQCLALWPGTSRSLVTIVAATLLGVSLGAAIEFSFLLGALTLGAATAWTLLNHGAHLLGSYGAAELLLGFAAAFITAWLSVRWMVNWLGSHGLQLFGWWRVLVGGAVAAALFAGVL
jgi:undecaprenyl-diphosphatase